MNLKQTTYYLLCMELLHLSASTQIRGPQTAKSHEKRVTAIPEELHEIIKTFHEKSEVCKHVVVECSILVRNHLGL